MCWWEFSKIPKKTRVFQNSKQINLPKYFWNLENSRFFGFFQGIDQKEVAITFSFYWQCLNRRKTLKTGGFFVVF